MNNNRRLKFVTGVEDVNNNIRYFAKNLNNCDRMIARLSNFSHWFYDDETGYFGPSKFIGYLNNSYDNYFKMFEVTDGRDTDDVLNKFYKEANEDILQNLYDKLAAFLGQYDKKPKKTAKIYVIK